jgi:TRAP-type C4-dicarboxylate transport system substrate-binding protein
MKAASSMNRKLCASVAVVCALTGALSACSSSSKKSGTAAGGGAGAGKSVTLKLATIHATTDPSVIGLNTFAASVSKLTNGTVKIKVYPNSELISQDKEVASIEGGAIPIGTDGDDSFNKVVPGVQTPSSPFLIKTWTQAKNVAESAAIQSQLDAAYAQHGLKFLGLLPAGFYELASTKPVGAPSDVKGVKVRVPGTATAGVVTALGGVPVVVALGDTYEALQLHTVNAVLSAAVNIKTESWYKAAKNVTVLQSSMGWQHLVINMSSWNKLSSSQQAAITTSVKTLVDQVSTAEEAAEQSALDAMKADGATIVPVSDPAAFAAATTGPQNTIQNENALSKSLTKAIQATAS